MGSVQASFRITIIYAVFAALWILSSDLALELVVENPQEITYLQTLKGCLFVLVTATMLFFLMLRSHRHITNILSVDSLTGLSSHYLFKKNVERKTNECPAGHKIVLFYVDVDGFKALNENSGYETADRFLMRFAAELKKSYPSDTLLGRFPPDQFAIAISLPRTDDLQDSIVRLKQLFNSAAKGLRLSLTCSIGVASFPEDGAYSKALMLAANTALREAKTEGNATHFHDSKLAMKAARTKSLLNDLKKAIDEESLSVVFQPKYNLWSGLPSGVEVLVRWNHPARGFIPPDLFIPLAEKNDLMAGISHLVITKAGRELADAGLLGNPIQSVAVNVSATEFNHPEQMDTLVEHIVSQGDLATFIRVEITETATLKDMVQSNEVIHALRSKGITFSIDDFGTGYTSLAMLKDFTIDELKIDRSYIAEIVSDKRSMHIVKAIIAMAENFGINIVAEGIETQEQLDTLKQLGCKEAQGYFLGAPMAITALKDHLLTARLSSL